MAEIGAAAIGGSANLAAAALTHLASFSARHDQVYEMQVELMGRTLEKFEALRRDSQLSDEDYVHYLELRERAKESAKAYRKSIREYKDVSPISVLTKREMKREVRSRNISKS